MLHGGGGSGSDWRYQYSQGWFGDLAGLKYVFPTSPNHLWYISFKNGCGLIGGEREDVCGSKIVILWMVLRMQMLVYPTDV